MGWRIVRQPNGLLARFSDIVDDFTDVDMTDAQALFLCTEKSGVDIADGKLARADEFPERFDECIEAIRIVHGVDESVKRRIDLSEDRST